MRALNVSQFKIQKFFALAENHKIISIFCLKKFRSTRVIWTGATGPNGVVPIITQKGQGDKLFHRYLDNSLAQPLLPIKGHNLLVKYPTL